jgi:hypothetical protein
MGESRFRVPRRPQNAFLLPEGEGQDEGKGGSQQPSRDLLFENPLPRLYLLQTSRNRENLMDYFYWFYMHKAPGPVKLTAYLIDSFRLMR